MARSHHAGEQTLDGHEPKDRAEQEQEQAILVDSHYFYEIYSPGSILLSGKIGQPGRLGIAILGPGVRSPYPAGAAPLRIIRTE